MRHWILVILFSIGVSASYVLADDIPQPLALEPEAGNTQDLIFPDHPVFRAWRDLFILSGRALPSSVGPLSRNEILLYLSALPEAASPLEALLRQRVRDRLDSKPGFQQSTFAFQAINTLQPELYLGNVTDPTEWYRSYYTQPPLWRTDFKFWGGNFLAFAFDLPVSVEPFAILDRQGPINSNIISNLGEWNKYFPFRGYIAAGGDFWSIQWGRGKLSYGPGRSGNILLSDAADWADFFAISLFWEGFKFHSVVINQDWYDYLLDTSNNPVLHPSGWYRSAEGAQTKSRFHTFHRLEFRPTGNFSFAISEAGAVETVGMDFRFLNPFFVYHNWFLSENSDSNAALDAEWTIFPGFSVYGAFLFDYITTPYKDQVFQDKRPLAYGIQLGKESLFQFDQSLLRFLLEAVYISPYAYTDRNFNWVQWRRHLSDYGEIRGRALLEQPLGYVLGPNSSQLLAAVSWEVPGLWNFGLDGRIVGKGSNNLLTKNPEHPDADDPPLMAPPYEKPRLNLILRAWGEWELESVGGPKFWTIRTDVLATQKSNTGNGDEGLIFQSALGLRFEW